MLTYITLLLHFYIAGGTCVFSIVKIKITIELCRALGGHLSSEFVIFLYSFSTSINQLPAFSSRNTVYYIVL